MDQLIEAVQHNCDVADAQYAGNYTMCIYLLKMRELYRWSGQYSQSVPLDRDVVSAWVENKEVYWDEMPDNEFRPLHINGQDFDPFDVTAINQYLLDRQLVYGAGYGRGCRPIFFLAQLQSVEHFPSYTIYVSDREYVRDLASPVAMSQGHDIYVRMESVRRMMWEQIEAWRWRKSPQDALASALSSFDLEHDMDHALSVLSQLQKEMVIAHEVGEVSASASLGDGWSEMVGQLAGSRSELIARALKDHLADALVTLPATLETGSVSAIHLFFANTSPLSHLLFPQLSQFYAAWKQSGEQDILRRLIVKSQKHWQLVCERFLEQYQNGQLPDRISDDDIVKLQPEFSV